MFKKFTLFNTIYRMYRRFGCTPFVAMRRAKKTLRQGGI